jgi:Concanavalin A-like lectin/glucanases superfamily
MSFNFSPKLSINGLVLCLDSANPKSCNDGDTNWVDLSNYKNDALIVGGVTYNNGSLSTLEFDGLSGYVESISLSSLIGNSTNFTIQMLFYPTDLQYGVSTTLFDTSNRHLSLWIGLDINDQFWGMGSNNGYYNDTNFYWENNKWQMVTVKKDGSVAHIIKNAHEKIYSFTPGSTYEDQLIFATNPSGGSPISNFKGFISFICFYNRALSETEINGNCNGIKSRGGV